MGTWKGMSRGEPRRIFGVETHLRGRRWRLPRTTAWCCSTCLARAAMPARLRRGSALGPAQAPRASAPVKVESERGGDSGEGSEVRARPHPQAEDDLELHVCQRRRSVLFQHQSLRSSCHQDEASLVQRIFLATSSPTRTVYNGLMISSEPSINQIIISKIDVQAKSVRSDLCHSLASIGINQENKTN